MCQQTPRVSYTNFSMKVWFPPTCGLPAEPQLKCAGLFFMGLLEKSRLYDRASESWRAERQYRTEDWKYWSKDSKTHRFMKRCRICKLILVDIFNIYRKIHVFIHFWSPFVQYLIYPLAGHLKHRVFQEKEIMDYRNHLTNLKRSWQILMKTWGKFFGTVKRMRGKTRNF